MPSYTITPRTKQMSDLVDYNGDVDFSNNTTTPTTATGITYTPSLPSIPAGKSAQIKIRGSVTTYSTALGRCYIRCSIDGFSTYSNGVVQRSGSAGTTSGDMTFSLTNTDTSAHVPEFAVYNDGSGELATFITTDSNYPIRIIHSYPFTAASDLTLISQVSKIYAMSTSPTNLSIETKPVNTTWKVVELDIGYLMRGFQWSTNSSQVVWDYDGFDIGVA